MEQDDLKQLRVEIDRNIQAVAYAKSRLGGQPGAREISIVYTKLQEAKMWVGKVMEARGSELPQQFRDEFNEETK